MNGGVGYPQRLAANSLTNLKYKIGRDDTFSEAGSTATQMPSMWKI